MCKKSKETLRIQFGSSLIDFTVSRTNTKYISISVKPTKQVHVKAPKGKNNNDIKQRVKNRAAWILKQKRYFDQFLPTQPERLYVSGESHHYLGRQYRLKVIHDTTKNVKLIAGYIRIYTPDTNNRDMIMKQLDNWYLEHAKMTFQKRFETCLEIVRKFKIQNFGFQMRRMKKRWGSCPKSKRILLNTHLIKTPIQCIDYVIIHELCHLKQPNHSKEFFNLLELCIPDWNQRKHKLETFSSDFTI